MHNNGYNVRPENGSPLPVFFIVSVSILNQLDLLFITKMVGAKKIQAAVARAAASAAHTPEIVM